MSEHNEYNLSEMANKTFLVQYKGGGYDGCFWEWNYCMVKLDSDGVLSLDDIASSGVFAIKTVEKFNERLNEKDSDMTFYNVESEHDITVEFYNDAPIGNFKGCLMWLSQRGFDYQVNCPICEQLTYSQDMYLSDYIGNGGIGLEPTDWHCDICEVGYTCDGCNKFDVTTKNRSDEDYLCDYCYAESNTCEICNEESESVEYNDFHKTHLCEECLRIEESIIDVSHHASINGHPLSRWYTSHDGIQVAKCINCGFVFSQNTDFNSIQACNH